MNKEEKERSKLFVMNLVDTSDRDVSYGVLVCENDNISADDIQEIIDEIKHDLESDAVDWMVHDVVCEIPVDYGVKYYSDNKVIRI